MSRIKHIICLILCVLSASELFSQNLSFKTTIFDFGTIAEDGGKVTCTFSFTNSGKSPVVIVTANSSCGCTVPQFSRQPIPAQGSSTITVSYDPMDRPGKFSKTVNIITAPGNKRYTLTIRGDVTPRQRSTEELYPFDFGGGLRLSANYYPLSHVEQGRRVETQIKYVNTSKRSLNVEMVPSKVSGALEFPRKITIPANTTGAFAVGYDLSKHHGRYGTMDDKYRVKVGGRYSEFDIRVTANGVDSFTDDQRSAPPICNIGTRVIRVGAVKSRKRSQPHSFTIENSGIRDLIIRAVDLDEGLTSTLKSGDLVAPSQVREFTVSVDGSKIDYSSFSRYIAITVNDPDMPLQRIRVIGTIEE